MARILGSSAITRTSSKKRSTGARRRREGTQARLVVPVAPREVCPRPRAAALGFSARAGPGRRAPGPRAEDVPGPLERHRQVPRSPRGPRSGPGAGRGAAPGLVWVVEGVRLTSSEDRLDLVAWIASGRRGGGASDPEETPRDPGRPRRAGFFRRPPYPGERPPRDAVAGSASARTRRCRQKSRSTRTTPCAARRRP